MLFNSHPLTLRSNTCVCVRAIYGFGLLPSSSKRKHCSGLLSLHPFVSFKELCVLLFFSALTLYVCTIVSFVNTRPPLRHLIPVLVIHWSGLAWNSLSEGSMKKEEKKSKQDGCVCPFANSSQLTNALFSWSGYFKKPIQMFALNSSWNGLTSAVFVLLLLMYFLFKQKCGHGHIFYFYY